MKKVLFTIILSTVLAAACVTIVQPAPLTPPPTNNNQYNPPPVSTPPPSTGSLPQSTPSSFNLPQVAVFNVQPGNVMSGQSATVTWDVRNAFDVVIEPGFGIIRVNGSKMVNPPFSTNYELTATNDQGSILATTTLTVSGAFPTIDTPVIKYFTANPYVIHKGESAVLSWQTTSGSSASIDRGVGTVPGEGTARVSPETTTTYMLTVTSPDGAQFQTVTVNVK